MVCFRKKGLPSPESAEGGHLRLTPPPPPAWEVPAHTWSGFNPTKEKKTAHITAINHQNWRKKRGKRTQRTLAFRIEVDQDRAHLIPWQEEQEKGQHGAGHHGQELGVQPIDVRGRPQARAGPGGGRTARGWGRRTEVTQRAFTVCYVCTICWGGRCYVFLESVLL